MTRYIAIGIGVLLLLLAAAFIYLTTAEIPAPTQTVERTLSDDRFPK